MKKLLTTDEIKNFKIDGAIVLRKKFDINWIEKLKKGKDGFQIEALNEKIISKRIT